MFGSAKALMSGGKKKDKALCPPLYCKGLGIEKSPDMIALDTVYDDTHNVRYEARNLQPW